MSPIITITTIILLIKFVLLHQWRGMQQMQHIVDSYQCEWKATLQDPEASARFKPFVNSDAKDTSIQMHLLRGQTSPLPLAGRDNLINLEQI